MPSPEDIKKKEALMKTLQSNVPAEQLEVVRQSLALIKDSEEDFTVSRKKIHELMDTSSEAMKDLIVLAKDLEHPRGYEVLSGFIKTAADLADQLSNLHKKRKDLVGDTSAAKEELPANGQASVVFSGSTTQLQQMLKKLSMEKAVKDDETTDI
jgi:hypothetical protein